MCHHSDLANYNDTEHIKLETLPEDPSLRNVATRSQAAVIAGSWSILLRNGGRPWISSGLGFWFAKIFIFINDLDSTGNSLLFAHDTTFIYREAWFPHVLMQQRSGSLMMKMKIDNERRNI